METTSCGTIYYSIAVTPEHGGSSTSLITIPIATVASITFDASSSATDAGNYAITVKAGFGSNFAFSVSTILASASMTYTYYSSLSCSTASFLPPYYYFVDGNSYYAQVLGTPFTDGFYIGIDSVSYIMAGMNDATF